MKTLKRQKYQQDFLKLRKHLPSRSSLSQGRELKRKRRKLLRRVKRKRESTILLFRIERLTLRIWNSSTIRFWCPEMYPDTSLLIVSNLLAVPRLLFKRNWKHSFLASFNNGMTHLIYSDTNSCRKRASIKIKEDSDLSHSFQRSDCSSDEWNIQGPRRLLCKLKFKKKSP